VNTDAIDREYFKWLYSQVASVYIRNSARTHWKMLRQFFTKEFVWFVPNDDNRIQDGKDLRYEFLQEEDIDNPGETWLDMPCSMLELLVALSRRLSFEAEGEPRDWFWELIDNMGLAHINDQQYDDLHKEEIDAAMDRIIWRNYEPNGQGGLFPMLSPKQDQRKVELWYQLNAYLIPDI
jgi:hypothetical protein